MEKITKYSAYFYGLAAIAGLIFTWHFNLQFISEHDGFSLVSFIEESFATNGASSITSDFIVVASVFFFWSFKEAKRLNMHGWWLFLIVSFGVALAFTMPLFMLMRERRIASLTANMPPQYSGAKQA